MEVAIIITWLVFSFVVGFLGADRKIGFGASFFAALLLSPLVGAVIALSSQRVDPKTALAPGAEKLINSGAKKYEAKDYEGAIRDFQEVLIIQPVAPNSNFLLARLYSLTGKKNEAYKHLSKAIEQGFENLQMITSPDFAFLREQKDFKDFALNGYKLTSAEKETDDAISKLERLAKLKKDGLLTEREFEDQKKRIVGS